MRNDNRSILPFDALTLPEQSMSPVDRSVAINLFLRAAYHIRDIEGIRYWLTQAFRMASSLGSITAPPSRTESVTLYQQQIMNFISNQLLRQDGKRRNMLQLLVSRSSSTSKGTSTSTSSGTSSGESWGQMFSDVPKTYSKSSSHTTTHGTSESFTQSETRDGENIRTSDIVSGYERLLQGCFDESFLRFYLRYHRAQRSTLFVESVNSSSTVWDSYIKWWLSAHSDRQSVLSNCTGGFLEATPADIYTVTIRIRPEYRMVAGWIHSHLSSLQCGLPDLRLFHYAVSLADTYIDAGDEIDPFVAVKELQLLIEPELDVFYGEALENLANENRR